MEGRTDILMDTSDESVKRLVDWENPPSIDDLRADLEGSRASHKTHVDKVNKWIDALRGKTHFIPRKGRSKMQPKLIRKQNEWRYSALEEPFLSTDDMFKVQPVTQLDVEAAFQNEMILNKQFRVDIPKVKFINKYIRDAVNTGTVIVKLNWETQFGQVREEVPVYTQTPEETEAVLMMQMQSGQIDEQTAQQILMSGQPIQIGVQSVMVEKEVVNRPVIQIKDTRHVVIDPSCEGDIDNAQFIIDAFLSDMSTLKKDGRYKNLEMISDSDIGGLSLEDYLYGEGLYKSDNDMQDFRFQDKPRKKIVVNEYWGYWDIHGDGIVVPIVATWVGNVMIRLEENPYPDKKLPYVIVQYLPPDDDSIYGEADAALLMEHQDIVGAITRSMIDLIGRSANAQQGVRKDVLDPINRKRFNDGDDFEFNVVNNLADAFYMTKIPDIPRSALEVIQMQNNEAEALTGVKAFSGGINSQALGDVVQGIRSAMDATAKREMSILRRLSEGLKNIARKIIAMNSVWLSDEEIIRITDREFVSIKRDDLAGNFDLSLNVSTAEMDNQKASDLSFMLQTIGNSMPLDIVKIIFGKIADLKKMPDLADMLYNYQAPPPDPMVVENQQLQNDMLKAQIGNEQAKAQENVVDVDLKSAKAETERAKARKLGSDADKQDLDFVEQASGLQQERELEKQLMGEWSKEQDKQRREKERRKSVTNY